MTLQRVRLVALGLGLAALRCGNGQPRPVEGVQAPPPRCVELEAKMIECAREAAGAAELPASVEAGLEEAAALNCRRLRSATGDHELPARIAATCGAESCADFPACVRREVEAAGVNVAPATSPPDGGPPLRDLVRAAGEVEAATEGTANESAAPAAELGDSCARFFERALGCAAGGEADGTAPLTPEAREALRQSQEAVCAEFERANLTATLGRAADECAEVPCADYSTCVAESMADRLQPARSSAELCAPFVEKMLACAEEDAGAPFDADRRAVAAIAFGSACADYEPLPADALESAFDSCAAVPCAGYAACVDRTLE